MNFAVVPGQGSHTPNLSISTFPEKHYWLDIASRLVGKKVSTETIDDHVTNQVAIVANAFAYSDAFRNQGHRIGGVAGYSVGQYAALGIAGVLEPDKCLEIVKKRAELMKNRSSNNMGMLNILGLDESITCEIVNNFKESCSQSNEYFMEISNFNSQYSHTLTGHKDLLSMAEQRAMELGAAKTTYLNVCGAWHSRNLESMKESFKTLILDQKFNDPKIPYVDNVTGCIETDGSRIKDLQLMHLTHPVQWRQSLNTMYSLNPKLILELSPGNQISKMLFFVNRTIPIYSWSLDNKCVELSA